MWLIYSSVQSYFQKSVYDGFYFLLLPTLIKTIWLWSETGNIALKLLKKFFKAVFCFLRIRHCNENCLLMFPKVIKYLPIFYRKKPLSYSLIKTNVDSQKKVTLLTYLTSKPLRRPWRFHLYLEWINKMLDIVLKSLPYLTVQSQQWKQQKNVWNLFKINNKDTRTTSLSSF